METPKALFIGRITAGVTHEIKNVLAIIKESAGLIEDLMALCDKDSPPPKEKLIKTLTKITDQVNRGVELSTRLNELAHTADHETGTVNLNTAVERVVSLSQRFARLKRVRLEAVKKKGDLTISTDPLSFLMLLFSAIELLMNIVGEDGVVSVEPSPNPGKLITISAVPVRGETSGPDIGVVMQDEGFVQVQDLARGLNMSVTLEALPLRIVVAQDKGS